MARTPDPKLHALWRDRIRRQEASGLTIEQFCAQEGVARSKFHAWKRRFRLMDAAEQCPALPAPSSFLPVTVRLLERGADEPPADRGRPAQRCPPSHPDRGPAPGLPAHPCCRRSQDQLRRHAMISLPHPVRVFLHAPATDLRKGFDALCGLVTTAFGQDPTSGHLFLFVNRRRDRIKILYWDRDGLAIWYKRLEIPGTFQIPRPSAEAAVDRDDSDPVVADPLRHRPEIGTATQALSAADAGSRKIDRRPLVIS